MEQVVKAYLTIKSSRTRVLRYYAGLLCVIALIGFGHAPLLRSVGSFLVVEDPLRPAAAIVVLGGQSAFREMEAARLYHAGWASRVVIARGACGEESKAIQDLGIEAVER